VGVAGDGERPPVFDGVHDLSRPGPQLALGDLRGSAHTAGMASCVTCCYAYEVPGEALLFAVTTHGASWASSRCSAQRHPTLGPVVHNSTDPA
jgi:hypothetical protein